MIAQIKSNKEQEIKKQIIEEIIEVSYEYNDKTNKTDQTFLGTTATRESLIISPEWNLLTLFKLKFELYKWFSPYPKSILGIFHNVCMSVCSYVIKLPDYLNKFSMD